MKYVIVPVFLLAALAAGQHWQVELVDGSCTPSEISVKRDSARTYVAYATGDGSIRIASKGAVWHYETLDTSLVRPDYGFHFALGPAGRMAVSGVDDSFQPVVLVKSDSGWDRVWTHAALQYYSPLARAIYGADSTPIVIYAANNYYDGLPAYVIAETWVDSVWHADTVDSVVPLQDDGCSLTLCDADCSPDAGPCFLEKSADWFPSKEPPTFDVGKCFPAGSGWRYVHLGGGFQVAVAGYDIVAGGDDTASAAVSSGGYLTFDQDSVWPAKVMDAAVEVDSAGRRMIAFVTGDSILRFAYKDTHWYFRVVSGVTTATCCDLAFDDDGQPLIAFEDFTGLSLAHGIDVLGVEESPKPQASSRKPAATVLSGASGVKRLASCVVFDAMGRRVANPRSGIFFVREAQAQAQAIRQVVIQR